jgi:hypothetical protein
MGKRHEVRAAPSAIEAFALLMPDSEEVRAVTDALGDLAQDPELGYRVAFTNPVLFRYDVGRFAIHYRFDEDYLDFADVAVL